MKTLTNHQLCKKILCDFLYWNDKLPQQIVFIQCHILRKLLSFTEIRISFSQFSDAALTSQSCPAERYICVFPPDLILHQPFLTRFVCYSQQNCQYQEADHLSSFDKMPLKNLGLGLNSSSQSWTLLFLCRGTNVQENIEI